MQILQFRYTRNFNIKYKKWGHLFSNKKTVAKRAYGRFVGSRISQGHRDDFYELTDQRFLGTEEFVDDIRRDLKERPSFVYNISIQELIDSVSIALNISR